MRHRIHLARIVVVWACIVVLNVVSANIAHADPVIPDCAVDSRYCAAFIPLSDIAGSGAIGDVYRSGDLKDFLNRLFVGAIALGAILAVLRLAWAGFIYMSGDLWSNKEHAKEIIRDTLLGLFLLLSIWLILKQINPDILKLKVEFKSSPSASSATAPSSSALPSSSGVTPAASSGNTAPTVGTAPAGPTSTWEDPHNIHCKTRAAGGFGNVDCFPDKKA